jgi:REP element-mobilizing transposase RayT
MTTPPDEQHEDDELRLKEEDGATYDPGDLSATPPTGREGGAITGASEGIESRPSHEAIDDSLHTARLITVACYRNLPLFGRRQIKDALVQDIRIVTRKQPFQLLAWCVLPEHAHFFTYPRVDDPSPLSIVKVIQQRFEIRVVRRWREINAGVLDEITDELGSVHVWEKEPMEDVVVEGQGQIRKVITLVESKPVRRGLVDEPEHWMWSSARRRRGEESHGVPIVDA